MEMSFEKTGEKWIVFADLDFSPIPEIDIFDTEDEAVAYFKDGVQTCFKSNEYTEDFDGNSLEDCIENQEANLGDRRVMILTGDTVRRRF